MTTLLTIVRKELRSAALTWLTLPILVPHW